MSHPPQPRSSGPGTIDWYGESRAISQLMREKEELRRVVEWLESCNQAAMDECQLLATRIAELELRVRILTLAQGCP